MSVCSLFIGVLDINVAGLLGGNIQQWEVFLISRLPRLLAILCTGFGMSIAGLIMQQLCMNKYEFIVDANPDYIFIMNRDAAIGADGADLAQNVIENELVMQTDTYKNGHIIYLANPGVWYTAEGGITALDIMLNDLETALLNE